MIPRQARRRQPDAGAGEGEGAGVGVTSPPAPLLRGEGRLCVCFFRGKGGRHIGAMHEPHPRPLSCEERGGFASASFVGRVGGTLGRCTNLTPGPSPARRGEALRLLLSWEGWGAHWGDARTSPPAPLLRGEGRLCVCFFRGKGGGHIGAMHEPHPRPLSCEERGGFASASFVGRVGGTLGRCTNLTPGPSPARRGEALRLLLSWEGWEAHWGDARTSPPAPLLRGEGRLCVCFFRGKGGRHIGAMHEPHPRPLSCEERGVLAPPSLAGKGVGGLGYVSHASATRASTSGSLCRTASLVTRRTRMPRSSRAQSRAAS